jgi:hypothetical protein
MARWLLIVIGALLVAGHASAAPQDAKKKKKGPNIVLPARKGKPPVKENSTPRKINLNQPEKVDLPGVTSSQKTNLAEELRGPTRIDFDDRLIQGQTNKSGAVYLFDRKETGISSMVRRRKSFKQLTLGTIYDR